MKCQSLRNYDTRNRSWKCSELRGAPITTDERILFSPPASLGDGFPPPFLGARRSLLLASHSLAWDSHALSPHMTLAACTRLPNAYNATPANGAICGKSFPSNLSFSPSPLSAAALSLSLVLTLATLHMHFVRYASSFPVHLSCSMPISHIQDLYSLLLSLLLLDTLVSVFAFFLLLLLWIAVLDFLYEFFYPRTFLIFFTE